GTIDVLDYTLWRDNLGAGVAPTITTGGALAVPEPSSLHEIALLLAATVCFCTWVERCNRPRRSRRVKA
ncbi:MAG: hypothetical protein AAGF31_07950, partial [Planctomycetota bacterium]